MKILRHVCMHCMHNVSVSAVFVVSNPSKRPHARPLVTEKSLKLGFKGWRRGCGRSINCKAKHGQKRSLESKEEM